MLQITHQPSLTLCRRSFVEWASTRDPYAVAWLANQLRGTLTFVIDFVPEVDRAGRVYGAAHLRSYSIFPSPRSK